MDAAALPPLDGLDAEALRGLLLQQRDRHREALSSSAQQIEHLKLTIEKLRRQLFRAKSEKSGAQLEQLELELDELRMARAGGRVREAVPDAETPPKSRPVRKPLPAHLPREVVVYRPKHACCPDCRPPTPASAQ